MRNQNQFGKVFRSARRARGLTQEDFWEESGSGRTYISELERGVKKPTLTKIDQLAVPLKLHPLTMLALSYTGKENLAALDKLLEHVRREAEEILRKSEQ
jgi:transcriptional regulator with XRE-family HTH domain